MAIRLDYPIDNSFLGTGNSLSEQEPGAGGTDDVFTRSEQVNGGAADRPQSDEHDKRRNRLSLSRAKKSVKDFVTGGEERRVKKRLDVKGRTAEKGDYAEALSQTALGEIPLVRKVTQYVENNGYLDGPLAEVRKVLEEEEPKVYVMQAPNEGGNVHNGKVIYLPANYDNLHDGEKLFALVNGAITLARERERLLGDEDSWREQCRLGIAFAQTLRYDADDYWPTNKDDDYLTEYYAAADSIEEQSRQSLERTFTKAQ